MKIKSNIFRYTRAPILILALFSCEKSHARNSIYSSFEHKTPTKNAAIDKEINTNLPSPDVVPQLKYTPIESIYGNPSDITHGENINEISLNLSTIASLTKAYHQELLGIQRDTNYLDFPHLMLLANACYFPVATYNLMLNILANPRSCEKLSLEVCHSKLAQVKSNVQAAIDFGTFVNQILREGLKKLSLLSTNQAYVLLSKSYAKTDSTNLLFKETLQEVPNLSAEEKLSLMKLAIEKSAWSAATDLALSWIANDSDRTFDSILLIANKFPQAVTRDEFLSLALDTISDLTSLQAKKIIQLAFAPLTLAEKTLNKVQNLTVHDLSTIISDCKDTADKESIIVLELSKFKTFTKDEAAELIRQSTSKKIQTAKAIIPLIPNLKPSDLVFIAVNAAFDKDREEIISSNIDRFASFNAADARLIAEQSGQNATRIVLLLLPKVVGLTGRDLAYIIEAINSGTERDEILLSGMKLVHLSDVNSDIAILNLAYNSKLKITIALLSKTPSLSTADLALVAKNCLNGPSRDQLLLNGTKFVSLASVEGVIAMVGLATQVKVNVALAAISKIPKLSASDFGLILKSLTDGPTRDQLITNGLSLIKKFNGDGAALIVERSFNIKVETATKLISLIPSATGTDLDKILNVCGSGNTRDLILSNAINLLGKLTKQEAKSLYGRAYSNKDTVAILLMSKVDNIDGQTIGEIALYSNKGSTRDLIVSEGLKRLGKIDTIDLIAMIMASDKLTERLALEVSSNINPFVVDNATDISNVILNIELRDRFLIHAVDLIKNLDEPGITQLALAASTQTAREEIVRKGVERMGGGL